MSLVMGNRKSHDWRLTLQPFNIFLTIKELDASAIFRIYTYVQMFKLRSGPLFQFQGGSPIPYAFVTNKMTDLLKFIGINPSFYYV
jgi:hypothetical protein